MPNVNLEIISWGVDTGYYRYGEVTVDLYRIPHDDHDNSTARYIGWDKDKSCKGHTNIRETIPKYYTGHTHPIVGSESCFCFRVKL